MNKIKKFRFESAYPIDSELYLKKRFELDGYKPHQITYRKHSEDTDYSLEEGLNKIKEHDQVSMKKIISMYEFTVTMDNTLIETFFMDGLTRFTLHTKVVDMKEFFNYIFPLMGVLLYGEFDPKEHFLIRDDVCCKFIHEIYPKHTEVSGTWWDDTPYINHFFAFPKSEWEDRKVEHYVALGGEPLEFGYEVTHTAANFYLMKSITRTGEEVYIQKADDMLKVDGFEREIVLATIEGIKKENIENTIHYIAF